MGQLLTILHISDTHFDVKARRSRIADALLRAVRGQAWEPDLCLFSGDLTLTGAVGEFDLGGDWLANLIAPPWRTKVFVVPGNHDVVRRDASKVLREAHSDSATFDRLEESLRASLPHLDHFRHWHEKGRSVFGDRLLSDWRNPFGCQAIVNADGWNVNLVGLNTALLSCGDDDHGRLVQDTEALENYLGLRSRGLGLRSVGRASPVIVARRMEPASSQTAIEPRRTRAAIFSRSSARSFGLGSGSR
jgi:hypothetical protein